MHATGRARDKLPVQKRCHFYYYYYYYFIFHLFNFLQLCLCVCLIGERKNRLEAPGVFGLLGI